MSRLNVFVSYCHRDRKWVDRLEVHLKPLIRRGELDLWDDNRIRIGDEWRREISQAVDRAAAAIVVVSADYLASHFVHDEELPTLLTKAQREGAVILPIVVQPCRIRESTGLAAFQSANPPDRPLSKMKGPKREEVFLRVRERIEEVLAERRGTGEESAGREKDAARRPEGKSAGVEIYAESRRALFALRILSLLAHVEEGVQPTLTELLSETGLSSRKLAHQALGRLADAGWVEKERVGKRTSYVATTEGVRQLQRLMAVTENPFSLGGHRPSPVFRPEQTLAD